MKHIYLLSPVFWAFHAMRDHVRTIYNGSSEVPIILFVQLFLMKLVLLFKHFAQKRRLHAATDELAEVQGAVAVVVQSLEKKLFLKT